MNNNSIDASFILEQLCSLASSNKVTFNITSTKQDNLIISIGDFSFYTYHINTEQLFNALVFFGVRFNKFDIK